MRIRKFIPKRIRTLNKYSKVINSLEKTELTSILSIAKKKKKLLPLFWKPFLLACKRDADLHLEKGLNTAIFKLLGDSKPPVSMFSNLRGSTKDQNLPEC